jgi:hypothetical protein
MASPQDEFLTAMADGFQLLSIVSNSPEYLHSYAFHVLDEASAGLRPRSTLARKISNGTFIPQLLAASSSVCCQLSRVNSSDASYAAVAGLCKLLRGTCRAFLCAAQEQLVTVP